ncbi:hypothetical protein BDZ91DRAFT_791996 [Kalaharituber pfeilii]|nr:hypothetical protein BDZ91DRAFT_791996 [Kalaharituber pfeilii]
MARIKEDGREGTGWKELSPEQQQAIEKEIYAQFNRQLRELYVKRPAISTDTWRTSHILPYLSLAESHAIPISRAYSEDVMPQRRREEKTTAVVPAIGIPGEEEEDSHTRRHAGEQRAAAVETSDREGRLTGV